MSGSLTVVCGNRFKKMKTMATVGANAAFPALNGEAEEVFVHGKVTQLCYTVQPDDQRNFKRLFLVIFSAELNLTVHTLRLTGLLLGEINEPAAVRY